ncbi:O-antigen ligase family protein [Brevundimonas sp.]|jgi:O-antigen ligase|uniref:O-antigen ligase family protein n=1 Tax=Brevundimonas sp. TaxID=1871086 RepID=UPI0037C0F7B9
MDDTDCRAATPVVGPRRVGRHSNRLRFKGRTGRLRPADYLPLAGPMALFCIAHLLGGAANPTAALWFTAVAAAALPILAALEARQHDLPLVWPGRTLIILFAAVLVVAAWTLVAPASGATSMSGGEQEGRAAITLDQSSTLVEIIKLCGLASVFFLGCFEGIRTRRATASIRATLTVGVVWATIGVILLALGLQTRLGGRLTGGFLSANSGATVYGILLVLSVAVLARVSRSLRFDRRPHRMTALGAAFFCVALFTGCLLATASRMGVVATALAVIFFLAWEALSRKKRPSNRTISLTVLGIAVAMVGIAGADTLWARLDTVDADAANRGIIFAAHWRAFLESPIFGHGLGSFTAINNQQMTPENYGALRTIRSTHNVYIQWLEEAGLLGAVPMFALIALIITRAVRRSGRLNTGATIQRGLIAANLVILAHGMTDYALQVPSIAAFWAYLLGLQFAYGKGRRSN